MFNNSDGLLIAASDYMSDFWQSDEQKITPLEHADYSLSDIEYDECTRKFIAHFTCRLTCNRQDNNSENAAILIVMTVRRFTYRIDFYSDCQTSIDYSYKHSTSKQKITS